MASTPGSRTPHRTSTSRSPSKIPRFIPSSRAKRLALPSPRPGGRRSPGSSPLTQEPQTASPIKVIKEKPLPSPPAAQILDPMSPPKAMRSLVDVTNMQMPNGEAWPILQPENISNRPINQGHDRQDDDDDDDDDDGTQRPISSSSDDQNSSSTKHTKRMSSNNPYAAICGPNEVRSAHSNLPVPTRNGNSFPGALRSSQATSPDLDQVHGEDDIFESPLARKQNRRMQINPPSDDSRSKKRKPLPLPRAGRAVDSCPDNVDNASLKRRSSTRWPLLDTFDYSEPHQSEKAGDGVYWPLGIAVHCRDLCDVESKPCVQPSPREGSLEHMSHTAPIDTGTFKDAPEDGSGTKSRVKRLSNHAHSSELGMTLTIADDADAMIYGAQCNPNKNNDTPEPSRMQSPYERSLGALTGRLSRSGKSSPSVSSSRRATPPHPEQHVDGSSGKSVAGLKKQLSTKSRLSVKSSAQSLSRQARSCPGENVADSPVGASRTWISDRIPHGNDRRIMNAFETPSSTPPPVPPKEPSISCMRLPGAAQSQSPGIAISSPRSKRGGNKAVLRTNGTSPPIRIASGGSIPRSPREMDFAGKPTLARATALRSTARYPSSSPKPPNSAGSSSKILRQKAVDDSNHNNQRAEAVANVHADAESKKTAGQATKLKLKKSFRNIFPKRDGKRESTEHGPAKDTKRSSYTSAGSTLAKHFRSSGNLSKSSMPMPVSETNHRDQDKQTAAHGKRPQQLTQSGTGNTILPTASMPCISARQSASPPSSTLNFAYINDIITSINTMPSSSSDRLRALEIAQAVVHCIEQAQQAKISAEEAEKHARLAVLEAETARIMLGKLQKLIEPSVESEALEAVKSLVRSAGLGG